MINPTHSAGHFRLLSAEIPPDQTPNPAPLLPRPGSVVVALNKIGQSASGKGSLTGIGKVVGREGGDSQFPDKILCRAQLFRTRHWPHPQVLNWLIALSHAPGSFGKRKFHQMKAFVEIITGKRLTKNERKPGFVNTKKKKFTHTSGWDLISRLRD